MFMECDMSRDKNFFGVQIIENKPLISRLVTQENRFSSSRVKFSPVRKQSGGIA
jgi:hypothetical protein